ncbi:hypothetical protein PC116_g1632 [Phytophthora cactorum]|nr:hypothetical protein PC120_g886 [Phytophthora cactorum]KAG4064158.1 hypothetical protein PC123_g1045 [Phytophthora cactorum]KAG4250622.1 hypothetical protein PC116_g1632 [Phytophthora cactorum]
MEPGQGEPEAGGLARDCACPEQAPSAEEKKQVYELEGDAGNSGAL